MKKSLVISVDAGSWPAGKKPPRKLLPKVTPSQVDVLEMMLRIGCLAFPTQSTALDINAWWAWLRYASAFSSRSDFLLRREYADVDGHQKTILSDDFGMGIALTYVAPALQLQTLFDGRYFVQFIAPKLGATIAKVAKNGQFKSPDFIGRDKIGRWHAIECKGTQTNGARETQMVTGRAQKANIVFPAAHQGQRLVSGLLIGRDGTSTVSSLLIEDPEGDLQIEITEDLLADAEEAMARATIARSLGVAGLHNAASLVAAPYGSRPFDRETIGRWEVRRKRALDTRFDATLEEFRSRQSRGINAYEDANRIGRQIQMTLPFEIISGEKVFRSISAVLSVPKALHNRVAEIAEQRRPSALSDFASFKWSGIKNDGGDESSMLVVGNILEGTIELLP